MLIGQYEVQAELGHGGMGVVYRAIQPSLNRVVALKTINASIIAEHPEALVRFRREGQIAAGLQHPGIVKVYEASLNEPPYYIAMDYLPGGDLEQRLRRGPVPIPDALHILAQVSSALDYAHPNIVHRDIKPANIMFDAAGRPVLIDFGIVRDLRATGRTIDGSRIGAPSYMSPEQARGETNIDFRSDLYSLAIVFYEMLVGNPPFEGDMFQVLYQVINDMPPPPSQVRPGLPPILDEVFARAFHKQPVHRFSGAMEFYQAVRQVLLSNQMPQPSKRQKAKPVRASAPSTVLIGPESPGTAATPGSPDVTVSAPAAPVAPQTVGKPETPAVARDTGKPPARSAHISRQLKPQRRSAKRTMLTALLVLIPIIAIGIAITGAGVGTENGGTGGPGVIDQLSAQKKTVSVPELAGFDFEAVGKKRLEEVGLKYVTNPETLPERSEQWQKIFVVSQDPVAGEQLSEGGLVTLNVALRIQVPEVAGMKSAAARKALEGRGLKVDVEGGGDIVDKQYPAAEGHVAKGDEVTLTLKSSGKKEPPKKEPPKKEPPKHEPNRFFD